MWQDEVTIFRDVAGQSLHKRGYRGVVHKAGLNESAAAGMLQLADWPQILQRTLMMFRQFPIMRLQGISCCAHAQSAPCCRAKSLRCKRLLHGLLACVQARLPPA